MRVMLLLNSRKAELFGISEKIGFSEDIPMGE